MLYQSMLSTYTARETEKQQADQHKRDLQKAIASLSVASTAV